MRARTRAHLPSSLVALALAGGCSGARVVEEVLAVNQVRLSDGTLVTYAGLEAPGPGSEMFEVSRLANADLVLGKAVTLVLGQEESPAESTVAFVYTPVVADGQTKQLFVNRELVLFGFAGATDGLPPDPREADLWQDLVEAERVARQDRLGLWAEADAAKGGAE
jgi:hypothetical protein